jgi:uncharacterized protein YnzC (UPF0291/DUF896 family)
MAYKFTEKGKKAAAKYPAKYKKLVENIVKNKAEVIEITTLTGEDFPAAKVKSYQLFFRQNGNEVVMGHSYQESKVENIIKSLRDLVGTSSSVKMIVDKSYVITKFGN